MSPVVVITTTTTRIRLAVPVRTMKVMMMTMTVVVVVAVAVQVPNVVIVIIVIVMIMTAIIRAVPTGVGAAAVSVVKTVVRAVTARTVPDVNDTTSGIVVRTHERGHKYNGNGNDKCSRLGIEVKRIASGKIQWGGEKVACVGQTNKDA